MLVYRLPGVRNHPTSREACSPLGLQHTSSDRLLGPKGSVAPGSESYSSTPVREVARLALCRLPCKHGCIFPTPFHSLRFPALLRLTLGASALIRRFVCPSLQFCRDSVPQIHPPSRRPDSLCRLRHGWCRQAIPSSLYLRSIPLFCLSTRHSLQPSSPPRDQGVVPHHPPALPCG